MEKIYNCYYIHHILINFHHFFFLLYVGTSNRDNGGIFQDRDKEQEHPSKRQRTKPSDDAQKEELPQDLFEQLRANESLLNLYREQWNKIKDSTKRGKLRDTYNFRLFCLDVDYLRDLVYSVFVKQKTAFKINTAFGFVLRNNETNELKYHYASSNTRVLNAPAFVQNKIDLMSFLNTFLQQDPLEYARLQRPNSKWVVDIITNLTLYIFRIPDHPIGSPVVHVPYFVS